MPPVPDAAYEALLAAAHSGQISKERLDASVRRILERRRASACRRTGWWMLPH